MTDNNDNDLFGKEMKQRGSADEFLIVGIGASAGGIKALQEFFRKVPATSGIAYVVILHLSPHHKSKLAEVLQTTSAVAVTQVVDRVKVVPDHVYVISPNQSLAMNNGELSLSAISRSEERRAPVDIFFRTLADSHHSRAVSVILSGTGADGSMGMKRVKESGGVCFVQEPEEADYPDMPRNAIATGLVDYILPVGDIPGKIIGYRNHLGTVAIPVEPEARSEDHEQALREVFTCLRQRTGHDFSNYKRATVLRRIERRINVHQLPDLPSYAEYLRLNSDETRALLKDLLISVTNFFRDREAFEALENKIIPKLFEGKKPQDHVRVWVAGCATGEEAYSVAMLLCEFVSDQIDRPNVQVFATEIDEWAINKAREGYYTLNDAADVSPERLRRFFSKDGDGYRVKRELRDLVLFARHNILKDPPFSHLDLVTCRNLIIYLNRAAQTRTMEVMHFGLKPSGYLFLGTSESVEGSNDLFSVIDKENHIFQSRPVETRLSPPLPTPSVSLVRYPTDAGNEPSVHERMTYLDLHRRLLEAYAPPSIVINEVYDVVHLSSRAGRFLYVQAGEPSNNLLKMIRAELRLELRGLLYQAIQHKQSAEAHNLPVRVNDHTETVNLIVRPVFSADDGSGGFILVLIEPVGVPSEGDGDGTTPPVMLEGPLARQLEDELMLVRSQLRSTTEHHELQQEELRASNEELQAMNEELRSAAEELETSKEELQSVNEELTTVNQELKVKIEEITQNANDFQNLINSSDIGTVFLDRSLRVKLFTPRAREIFNLIPTDIARPLSDITTHLLDEPLADLDTVIETLQPLAREVKSTQGESFLMRVAPYRTADDRINGVVLTFVNVTERRELDQQRRRWEDRWRRAIEIETVGIVFFSTDGTLTEANDAYLKMFGYSRTEFENTQLRDEDVTAPDHLEQQRSVAAQVLTAGYAAPYEKLCVRKDGTRWWALSAASRQDSNEAVEFLIDITQRKETETELQQIRKELEERVKSRTSALAEANQALQSAHEARAQVLSKLVGVQEDERRRVARDLHDQLGQRMTALRMQLETLKARVVGDAAAHANLERAQMIARQLESDLDFLASELRPLSLDDLGLQVAIQNYVREWSSHFGRKVDFHSTGLQRLRLATEIETNLYRITQEALHNVLKHAKASRVDVILERRGESVVLIVEDDGVGFDPEVQSRKGHGLSGIRERISLINGSVEIESAPNQGTTLLVRVPLVKQAESEARD